MLCFIDIEDVIKLKFCRRAQEHPMKTTFTVMLSKLITLVELLVDSRASSNELSTPFDTAISESERCLRSDCNLDHCAFGADGD